MFFSFFTEFKCDIYKKGKRRYLFFTLPIWGFFIASILTLFSSAIISFFFNNFVHPLCTLIINLLSIVFFFVFLVLIDKSDIKNKGKYFLIDNNTIAEIIKLLIKYNFYTKDKITWLIKKCDNEILSKKSFPYKETITLFIAPLTIAFLTFCLKQSIDLFIAYTVSFGFLIFFVAFISAFAKEFLLYPNKKIYELLKDKLEYILLDLKEEKEK